MKKIKILGNISLSIFEIIWLVFFTFLLVVSNIMMDASTFAIITALMGMINVVLVAKQNFSNYFFGLINTIMYIVVAYSAGYAGDFVLFLLYVLPLQFVGMYAWKSKEKLENKIDNVTHVVESKTLDLKGIILTVIALILSTILVYLFMPSLTNIINYIIISIPFLNGDIMPINSMPLADAFTTTGTIVAGVLMALKYKEQWIIWILVDVFAVIMWISKNDIAMTIMFLAYLINAIYGTYVWYKNSK